MNDSKHPNGARRQTVILAVAAGIAVLASGCRGGGAPASAGASPGATRNSSTVQHQANMLAYSRCVRSHGVPKFPDPSNGNLQVNGNALGVSPGVLQAAEQACGHLLAGGGGLGERAGGQHQHLR